MARRAICRLETAEIPLIHGSLERALTRIEYNQVYETCSEFRVDIRTAGHRPSFCRVASSRAGPIELPPRPRNCNAWQPRFGRQISPHALCQP